MFNFIMASTNPSTGVFCLSAHNEYVCVSASARVFEGEVGLCACYGMS